MIRKYYYDINMKFHKINVINKWQVYHNIMVYNGVFLIKSSKQNKKELCG
jgi:hypothetical protein